MKPVIPKHLINYIDSQYPQAKEQSDGVGSQFYLEISHAPKVQQILTMAENIPSDILMLDNESEMEFNEALSAIRFALETWRSGDKKYQLKKIPGRQQMHPFTMLRKNLIKLEDNVAMKREGDKDMLDNNPDPRKVFVVHGRDTKLRNDFFSFLRALNLQPIEWSEALGYTGKATPYIGEAIDSAFKKAQAVIVLLTPDDEVRLIQELWDNKEDENEKKFKLQARPNVLFEAGMAFGTHPDRTILIEVGDVKKFSDVAGRHVVKLSNSSDRRNEIVNRLKTAKCDVSTSGSDWLNIGDFNVNRNINKQSKDNIQTDLRRRLILSIPPSVRLIQSRHL